MKYAKDKRKKKFPWWIAVAVIVLIAALVWCHFNLRAEVVPNGSVDMLMNAGDVYTEKGATALYKEKTYEIDDISGEVDTSALGVYNVTYSFRIPLSIPLDIYVRAVRSVTVEDHKLPELALAYTDRVIVPLGGTYDEAGYVAIDNLDGDITSAVTVEGTVDTSVAGEYVLSYSVTDSCGNKAVATRTVIVTENSPLTASLADYSLEGYFPLAMLTETPDAGEEYIDGTIFIGDSLTINLGYFGNVAFENIWAIESIHPQNAPEWPVKVDGVVTEFTVPQLMEQYKPPRIIMMLGMNCVAIMPVDEFIGYYESFIEQLRSISPETQIIIESVTPVLAALDNSPYAAQNINNTKINIYNYYIADMCERMGLKFLNSAEALKDENGQGREGLFYTSDGTHILPSTNELLLDYIRKHAYIEK